MTQTTDAVIWDWNGTLLDDVECARRTMNVVLTERDLAEISDANAYRSVFGFPIRDFYARLGVGSSDFESAADRYLTLFADAVAGAPLHSSARATLAAVGERGIRQVLISAIVESTLHRQLQPHALVNRFDGIHGITDVYDVSKAHVAAGWLAESGLRPDRVAMIGDTAHDRDIAHTLGVRFIGFARGHQLTASTHDGELIDDLARLPEML